MSGVPPVIAQARRAGTGLPCIWLDPVFSISNLRGHVSFITGMPGSSLSCLCLQLCRANRPSETAIQRGLPWATILIVFFWVLLLLVGLPTWPYSSSLGIQPSGRARTGPARSLSSWRSRAGSDRQGYSSFSLEVGLEQALVKITRARIWVHSETTFRLPVPILNLVRRAYRRRPSKRR